MVKKVKKSLLAVCIAIAVIAMVAVPVAAQLPAKNPLPKGNPWDTVWSMLKELQKMIKAIPAGPTGPTGPQGPTGPAGATVHFGEWQSIAVDKSTHSYEATADTDGIVIVLCQNYGGETQVSGYDAGITPKEIVVLSVSPVASDGYARTSITMPVRQGDSWGVGWYECNSWLSVKWLPLSA